MLLSTRVFVLDPSHPVCQAVKTNEYAFKDENQFKDSKNPFEEGMALFKAGPLVCQCLSKWLEERSVCRACPQRSQHYHTRRLTAGELHDAILAFQADVQQNDDSSEVCLPA